jgi:uncharacterized GH25 family protein
MQRFAGGLLPAFLILSLSPACCLAHDFWIEPSSFRPATGELLNIGLRVGEHFVGEAVVRDPKRMERLVILSDGDPKPVPGVDGEDPAGIVRPDEPGVHIIGYRSKHSSIELEADKFEAYLREEGIESIIEERAKRGESSKPGREIYSRCAKSLIAVGGDSKGDHKRSLDFRLELFIEQNPYATRTADAFDVKLIFEGKPLSGTRVAAIHRDDGKRMISGRTDRDGLVRLTLERPGVWLIKSVHMFPAAEGKDADWQSLWASLTFELPEASATQEPQG